MRLQTLYWESPDSDKSLLFSSNSIGIPLLLQGNSPLFEVPINKEIAMNPGGFRQVSFLFHFGQGFTVVIKGVGTSSLPTPWVDGGFAINKLQSVEETLVILADTPADSLNYYSKIDSISIVKTTLNQKITDFDIFWSQNGMIGPFVFDTNTSSSFKTLSVVLDPDYIGSPISIYVSAEDPFNLNSYVQGTPNTFGAETTSPAGIYTTSVPLTGLMLGSPAGDNPINCSVKATVLQQGSGY